MQGGAIADSRLNGTRTEAEGRARDDGCGRRRGRRISLDSICYLAAEMQDRVPLYVRLPRDQAVALDRLVDTTGRRKQQVVAELLADRLEVGRIDIAEKPNMGGEEVLTLEELASMLRLPMQAVQTLALDGELPGRRIAGEWRFGRSAVLEWLARGEGAERGGGEAPAR